MLEDVVSYLRCPYCDSSLTLGPHTLRCAGGHSFDIAAQGYVNLMRGPSKHSGDGAAMVQARAEFLSSGHYDFLIEAVADKVQAVAGHGIGSIVEAGAGTGHYLAAALDGTPNLAGIALDASRYAARRAARAHPRIGAVVCDTWDHLPIASGGARVALVVFSPRNASELQRILGADGTLIVATPAAEHLQQLVEALDLVRVDADKSARLEEQLGPHFEQLDGSTRETTLSLRHEDVRRLVFMGPSAHHLSDEEVGHRIAALPETLEVTASVVITSYRPLPTDQGCAPCV